MFASTMGHDNLLTMDDLDIPQIPNCAFHPERDSVDRCSKCGRWICSDCVILFEGTDLCKECMVQHRKDLTSQLSKMSEELELWKGRLKSLTTTESLQFPNRESEIREKIEEFTRRLDRSREILGKIMA